MTVLLVACEYQSYLTQLFSEYAAHKKMLNFSLCVGKLGRRGVNSNGTTDLPCQSQPYLLFWCSWFRIQRGTHTVGSFKVLISFTANLLSVHKSLNQSRASLLGVRFHLSLSLITLPGCCRAHVPGVYNLTVCVYSQCQGLRAVLHSRLQFCPCTLFLWVSKQ